MSARPATSVRALGAVTGAVVVLAGIGGYELAHRLGSGHARPQAAGAQAAAGASDAAVPILSQAAFQRRSGVRIVRVAVSGDGGLVDLRYRVIDPGAATGIHSQATPPQLVDESTHVVVDELLMGHSHKGALKPAQTYYLVFNNPGDLVRAGTRVTVQLGSARIAHVPVR